MDNRNEVREFLMSRTYLPMATGVRWRDPYRNRSM